MAAFDAHKNLAIAVVTVAPTPPTTGTTLEIGAAAAAAFPVPPFNATVWPASEMPSPLTAEIVRVTAAAAGAWTIQRTAEEGGQARAIVAGDLVMAGITAKTITDIEKAALDQEQTTTATGALANFDLIGPAVHLRCTGPAPVFSGFTVNGAAPYAGCRVVIDCLDTSAKVQHENTGSAAPHRIACASIHGQILGTRGQMELIYDAAAARWRAGLREPGAPIAIPFLASDFDAIPGTWTVDAGDIRAYAYVQLGRRLSLYLQINQSSVAGGPGPLRVRLPDGMTSALPQYSALAPGYDNNVFTAVVPNIAPTESPNHLRFNRADFGSWANSTNATWIYAPGLTLVID